MQDFEGLIIPFLIELAVLAYVLLIEGSNEVSDREDAPAPVGAEPSRRKAH